MRKLLLLIALGVGAMGQSDQARLVGTITDSSGAVIPKASVSATDAKTGSKREVTTDGKGYYIITNLAATNYSISVSATNFAEAQVNEFQLSVGQERTLNISLQTGSVATVVNVVGGELTEVETASASIGTNVNSREVGTLPLNGRQLSQLYLLTPGAQTAGGGSFDNIRFSGRANQQNAVRFDGIEGSSIIDASPGNLSGETSTGFRLQASLETISEFRVDSSNYPAEFGTGSAGQISVVTKSGGNAFHGGLFEYFRNDKMDARNFFDFLDNGAKTELRLNQYGGSVGGPIKKDKLFFFAAIEALNQRAGVNQFGTVPSAAARARAVPSIRPLLAGYPTGIPTSNPDLDLARITAPTALDEYFGSARLDYHMSDRLLAYLRYNRDQGYSQSPLDVSGSYQVITATPQNAVLGFQQILSPTVINEAKVGFNSSKTRISGFAPAIPGVDTSAFAVSFTGNVAIPGIGGQGTSAGASNLGNLIRGNSTQNGRGQPYTGYTLSFIDSLNVTHQNHAMKFGGEFRPVRIYTDRLGGTTYTYSSLANLLNNTGAAVQVLGDVSAPDPFNGGATGNRFLKQYYLIGYAQDEWKIRPNLTMSYGLRYEYYSVMHEDRNLSVLFNALTGQIMPNSTPWYNSSKTNFGPRLAFAWSPERFKNRTVFRVGAGYYYGPGQTEDQVQPIDSDRPTVSIASTSYPVIPASVLAGFTATNHPNYQPRGYAPNYTLPEKILSYTASVQQQLPGHSVLTVAYVGSQGRNLFLRSWTNGIVGVSTNPTTGAGTALLQFGTQFSQIDYKTSGGTDNYNSLQTSLNRRFSKGLTAGFQWTYGHSLGNTGGSNEAQTAQNPFNFGQDRGNNAFDVRHSMNLSILYEVPSKFQNHMAQTILGGWEVGGVMNARTGLPIDVTVTRPDIVYLNPANNTYVTSPIAGVTVPVINNPFGGAFRNNRRPNVVAGVDPLLHTSDSRIFLNPAAFAIPQPGTFGNLGRYAIHGPGLQQLDFTLHKRIRIDEIRSLEFRAEVYNILNRANFQTPPATLGNALGTGANQFQPNQPYTQAGAGSTFGISQTTVSRDVGLGAQRQIQLSLRFNF